MRVPIAPSTKVFVLNFLDSRIQPAEFDLFTILDLSTSGLDWFRLPPSPPPPNKLVLFYKLVLRLRKLLGP